MVGIYDDLQGIASDVLGDLKQGVIEYIAVAPGDGSPDEPGDPTETVYSVNAVARVVSSKYVDNSNIFASDLRVTMPGDGVQPDNSGFITIDGARYKIVQIMRKPAAGVPVAYTVIVRR